MLLAGWRKGTRPGSRFRWSLRAKIIAWSFVPTTIILVAVALVTFYAYQQVTEDLVVGRNQELTRLSTSQLAMDMAEYTSLLVAVARSADVYGGDSAAQRAALERARSQLLVFDAGVVVLDSRGTVAAADPSRPEGLGQDWSTREYFRQLLRSSGPVFSDILTDGPGGAEVIVAAVPITGNQGEFRGAMVGMFRLGATAVSAFYGGIVKLRLGESGTMYMVDGSGRVIYHSDADRIGEDFSRLEVVRQLLSRRAAERSGRDLGGRDRVSSFAFVPGTPWGLVAEESWAALMSSSQGYRMLLLLLLAMGVVVPAVVVTVAVRRITGPIASLIGAAQEVAGGSFGREIAVGTGDELEDLAQQFNLMSAQLQESYAGLERKVAARTRDLATLNAIATVVSRSLDLDEILSAALDETLKAMELKIGGIYLLDREGQSLKLAVFQGGSAELAQALDRLQVGEGFSGRVVQTGEPLLVEDIGTDPLLTRMAARETGMVSLAVVPVSSRRKVSGTLFIGAPGRREFTSQEVQLLSSIGHQIGVAVENAHLFGAVERRAEQFRLIGEVGHRITSIMAVDRLLEEIVLLVRETLGYSEVIIGLIEDEELVFKAGAGPWWSTYGDGAPRFLVGRQGITGAVAQSGEPLLAPDVSREPRYVSVPAVTGTRSELAVPLKTHEKVIGVLDVQSDRLNAFDESDLAVLQSLAHQATVAIENARLYERAQQLAVMEERNRLARDLHDSVTQAVYGVTLYAEAAARLLNNGNVEMAASHLRELRSTAQQALREMRSLIYELRPPVLEKEGLAAALQARLEAVEGRAGLATRFKVEGDGRLPARIEGELYRIVQESLNNILKHAEARSIKLDLQWDQQRAVLEIVDDGKGFEPAAASERGGLGLRGMAERVARMGGQLSVTSAPGKGTTIRVEVATP